MGISRRKLLQVTGAATVGAALGMHRQVYAQGAKKKLKILQWNHFVPGYDKWFNGEYIKEWGEKNDTEVTVDNVGIPAINPTAAARSRRRRAMTSSGSSGRGRSTRTTSSTTRRSTRSARRSTASRSTSRSRAPSTRRPRSTSASPTATSPDPINYRKDLWDEIGMQARQLGRHPRRRREDQAEDRHPGRASASPARSTPPWRCAPSSTPSAAREQDDKGNLILNSKNTVEAVKFVKALYKEAMTPEVLAWDASRNNRAMLAGKARWSSTPSPITRERREREDADQRQDLARQGGEGPGAPDGPRARDERAT